MIRLDLDDPVPPTTDSITHELKRNLVLLRLRWGVLALAIGLSLAAAGVYHYFQIPQYVARAQVMIERRMGVPLGRRTMLSSDFQGLAYEVELLGSQEMAERVAARLREQGTYYHAPQDATADRFQRRVLGLGRRYVPGEPQRVGAGTLRQMLQVTPVADSNILSLAVRSADPQFAAAVANAYAASYVEDAQRLNARGETSVSERMARRLEAQRRRLGEPSPAPGETSGGVADGSGAAGAPGTGAPLAAGSVGEGGDAAAVGEETLKQLETRVNTMSQVLLQSRMERVTKETIFKRASSLTGEERLIYPPVMQNAAIQTLSGQLTGLRQERIRLSETFGERHPDMLKINEAIRSREQALDEESARVVRSLEQDFLQAQAREQELEAALVPVQAQLDEARFERSRRWASQKEAQVDRQIYNSLLEQTKLAEFESQLGLNSRRVVSLATPPGSPSSPGLRQNYRNALLLGLLVGALFVIGREEFADTVESPAQIKDDFGLPLLGLVPTFTGTGESAAPAGPWVTKDGFSTIAEAYRIIRSNLLFSGQVQPGSRLLLTSVHPGEGKSTTVANLAAALAENDARVLAIDADLRRPSLHRHFAAAQAPGLTDLATHSIDVAKARHSGPPRTPDIITSGRPVAGPAELLGSESMLRLLAEVGQGYDWVLIDSPPVLAVADTIVLTRMVDGIVLVVEAGKTPRAALQAAIEQIASVGGRIVGVVLNKLDVKRSAYTGSYHYGEYYRSRYSPEPHAPAPPPAGPRPS